MGQLLTRLRVTIGRSLHTGGPFASRPGGWRVLGSADPEFAKVRAAFESCFDDALVRDAQLAIYHRGRLVIDLHGTSGREERPYDADTLQCVFSCTKVLSGLAVAMLADRGHIEYDAPICKYWPEFGCNGKEHITVAALLQHDAGMPWLDGGQLPAALLHKPEELSALLASQSIQTEERVYHAVSQGLFLNELFRRADPLGRTVGAFVREEICARMPALDVTIGFPPSEPRREASPAGARADGAELASGGASIAPVHRPSLVWAALNVWLPYVLFLCIEGQPKPPIFRARALDVWSRLSIWSRSMFAVQGMDVSADFYNSTRGVELPSSNGMASARTLARLGALIAHGGELDGVRLLSRRGLEAALGGVRTRADLFSSWAVDMHWTQCGWHCFGEGSGSIPSGMVGWMGWGGSLMLFDVERQLSIALATPSLTHDLCVEKRWARVLNPLMDSIQALNSSEAAPSAEPSPKASPVGQPPSVWALPAVDPRWAPRCHYADLLSSEPSSRATTPPRTPGSSSPGCGAMLWSPILDELSLVDSRERLDMRMRGRRGSHTRPHSPG